MRALLCAVLLVAGCEKASRIAHEDAAPPPPRPVDAAPPPPPDAAPPPPDAAPPPPDAAPPPPDAGPGPRKPPKEGFDACETDDDCTMYGDPCGDGMIPVNKRYKEQARAAAKKHCPRGPAIAYLTALGSLDGRCVKKRCHATNEIILP